MKRKDLIKLFERNGWSLDHHSGNHDIYRKGNNREIIPRHREIKENMAKSMIKRWELK